MDFNDDGLLDLIVGEREGYVNYFRRLPDSTLTEEPDIVANNIAIDVGFNSAPQVVDWNEDGLLDLIIGNSDTSPVQIRLYLNSGTPSDYLFTTYSALQCAGSPISYSRCNPHVTDLNLDGKKDLVIGEDYGYIYYLENEGTNASPVFNQAVQLEANGVPISFPSGYTDLKVWVNDWNEDGTGDLIVGNYKDSVHLYVAYPIGIEEEQSQQKRLVAYAIPNPTINGTTIHYQVIHNGVVDLSVYDAQGRLVKTLVSEHQAAGAYAVMWDGMDERNNSVAAGVYFYKLTVERNMYIDKLVVLR